MQLPIKALALALLAGAAGAARAGFTTSAWLDASYDATQPLANGMVYFVTNSVTFDGAYDGKSGLAVAPSAEVVIFVQEDCRLYARGKDGETGGMGGGAGILCPSNSTLIITGPGHVQATGGGGANGGGIAGVDSDYGYMFENSEVARAYKGGNGGAGGTGGGAGIGGAGGSGGAGGIALEETPRKMEHETYDANGQDGQPGGPGGDGGNAGTVWLLGTASLSASGGGGSSGGGGYIVAQLGKKVHNNLLYYDYCIGGARQGGGGAGGMSAAGGIGGGGAGGGGGGSGGNGGYYCWYGGNVSENDYPSGGRGYCGKSENGEVDGGEAHTYMEPVHCANIVGGTGGAGGAAGKSGTGGRLNIFPTATFDGTVANDEKYGTFSAPDSVRYVLSFESAEPAKVYLGKPSSEISAPVPKRFGKTFQGWFTAANGGGERWFDASGAADFGCYATVGDTTLYASWSDTQGFDAADYRLRADGIGIDGDEVVIPFHAEIPANLDYALDFVKVRSSPTLPIPTTGPAASATLETLEDGGKAMVVPVDTAAPSMFYRLDIDVGD